MSLAERSRAAEVIKKFFSKQPQYVFGFIVGSGASGLAMCFHDTLAKPDESQRFVVKTAHSDEGGDIVNEKIWLEVRVDRARTKNYKFQLTNENTRFYVGLLISLTLSHFIRIPWDLLSKKMGNSSPQNLT